MRLDHAINQSHTCKQFDEIFSRNVDVQINTLWGIDAVKVEGFEGTVTTDLIARAVSDKFNNINEDQAQIALRLADSLTSKVFVPLRDRIIQLDRSNCTTTLLYKMRNCGRIGFTPEDRNLTAGYPVLKHSMCVMFLNKSL
ncbi:MAG: hypothetical protein JSS09_01585 [Verrucomicrobia bacterium]|nr:hypothetical protein [Verrucomicrobiota bacterium]